MNIVIFGCGQAGRMVRSWLPAGQIPVAYADNNPKMWSRSIDGIPIIPPGDIPSFRPDLVWIAVINKEAALSIERQLRSMGVDAPVQSLTPLRERVDLRLSCLRLLARQIQEQKIPGAAAELGVYQGVFAAEINRLLTDRPLYLFDTFEGFAPEDVDEEKKITPAVRAAAGDFGDTSVERVMSALPHPEQAVVCKGRFPESLPPDLPPLAFVSLDPDLYEPVWQGLNAFWPRLSPGGVILIHDCFSAQFEGVGRAVRRFCQKQGLTVLPVSDLHGSGVLVRQG